MRISSHFIRRSQNLLRISSSYLRFYLFNHVLYNIYAYSNTNKEYVEYVLKIEKK